MQNGEGACLVCGEPIEYFDKEKTMICKFCGREFETRAACESGHFICDECHAANAKDEVIKICLRSKSRNPIDILQEMMALEAVHMHGPEHHIMVGAALITAYRNAGGDIELCEALREMKSRGGKYPGGSCGFWGCCGAAVSTGMFISIITRATPLATTTWGQANLMTSRSLSAIGAMGGPRCCKRNSFTAVREAAAFIAEEFGVHMELPERIVCTYSHENKQCLGLKCPYHMMP